MKKYTKEELAAILKSHAKWLSDDEGGQRANLSGANLRGANLRGANLSCANLSYSNLRGSDLSYSNLCGANLSYSNLSYSDLSRSDLRGANLSYSNLSRSDLSRSDLRGASLIGTVLDPDRDPTGDMSEFEQDGEYVIGYRTRLAGHIDSYRDGRCYSADWFSCCPRTECHPGLHLWPTLRHAKEFSGDGVEFIRVRTKPSEIQQAGSNWRCRWFEVLGSVE